MKCRAFLPIIAGPASAAVSGRPEAPYHHVSRVSGSKQLSCLRTTRLPGQGLFNRLAQGGHSEPDSLNQAFWGPVSIREVTSGGWSGRRCGSSQAVRCWQGVPHKVLTGAGTGSPGLPIYYPITITNSWRSVIPYGVMTLRRWCNDTTIQRSRSPEEAVSPLRARVGKHNPNGARDEAL